MFVLVNPNAKGGMARERWPRIEDALRARVSDLEVQQHHSLEASKKAIRAQIDQGTRCIVAAGGDGSTNFALNVLMDPETDRPRDPTIVLGAIGIGSSNDFHKPFGDRLAGAPARVNVRDAKLVDIGKAALLLPDGSRNIQYFLINASMGLVAAGNHSFAIANGMTHFLKRRNTDAAIAYTAMSSTARFKPLHLEIRSDEWSTNGPVTNVGVLKSVHFAGGMRYDTNVVSDDGQFDVNIWGAASKPQIAGLIAKLYRGRFSGTAHATCRRSRSVELRPECPTPLELDGETTMVEAAQLEVIPKALLVCA